MSHRGGEKEMIESVKGEDERESERKTDSSLTFSAFHSMI